MKILFIIQSYLLFNTLLQELSNDEKEFLLKVSENDIKNAKHRLKEGVDVNVQKENGMTGLMIASEAGYVELVEDILNARADVDILSSPGDTALVLASKNRQNNCVRNLLKFGANTNIQGNKGYTALIHAAMERNIECLEMLLNNGANPNLQDNFGNTALSLAANRGDVDCMKKLIEAGADVNNDINGEAYTPLLARNPMSVKELIRAGADLNIRDKRNRTVLMGLSRSGKENLFLMLMKAGAEVNGVWLADIARN